jgi:uncharacterized iron-regulated protein
MRRLSSRNHLVLLHLIIILTFPLFLHASASQSGGDLHPPTFTEWQVIEVQTAQPMVFDEWVVLLNDKDVIYLGEEHRNKWHIEAALRLLRAFLEQKRNPVLALEMFGWDGQGGLNQYLSGEQTSQDQFLRTARWEQNWGGSFDDYAPLISFAREHRLPVLALNPPRPLVRRVAVQGLTQALFDVEMTRWGMRDEAFIDAPAYRDVIVKQLRLCHGGLSDDGYRRMYEASLFRDEGMAKTIADYLARTELDGAKEARPVLSYTGGGHIQYRLPVPDRVVRKSNGAVKQTTVYMTSFDPASPGDVTDLLRESIADYIWLTPMSAYGPATRCR